jgi:hypothetical protein
MRVFHKYTFRPCKRVVKADGSVQLWELREQTRIRTDRTDRTVTRWTYRGTTNAAANARARWEAANRKGEDVTPAPRKARQPKRWTLGAAFAYASERWSSNAEGAVRLATWALRRMAGHTPSTAEGRARLDANARGARYPYHAPEHLPGEPLTLADVRARMVP